jgi:ubiquinone/menaquinone biosynthesis C-methylase UbiE
VKYRDKANWFQKYLLEVYPYLPDASLKIVEALEDNKNILELGCGDGILTNRLVVKCNKVIGIDIDDSLFHKIQPKDNLNLFKMDAHNLEFPDNYFDNVVGLYVIHHLDIERSAKEINRVLKPNGRAIFIEPLCYNPLSNLWRKLTPNARTKDEKPLSYKDIKAMCKYFSSYKYSEFNLLPLLSSVVYAFSFSPKLKNICGKWLSEQDDHFLNMFGCLKKYSGSIQVELVK